MEKTKLKETEKYEIIKRVGKLWNAYVKKYRKLDWNDLGVRTKIDMSVANIVYKTIKLSEKSYGRNIKSGKANAWVDRRIQSEERRG